MQRRYCGELRHPDDWWVADILPSHFYASRNQSWVSIFAGMQKQLLAPFPCLSIFLILLAGLLHATPDSNVRIHEKLLCTNADSYAVIREETDNMGTYYRDYRKVWLDEYSKNDGPEAKPKTTMLLDQIIHRDVNDGTVTTTEKALASPTPSLSDLVTRYSLIATTSWTQEQMDTLEFDSKTGRVAYKSQCMVKAALTLQQGDSDSGAGDRFHLVSVLEDSNTILLTISTDMGDGGLGHVICVSPDVTRNVRALRKLDPVYLSIGSFKSAKEALDFRRDLDKNNKSRRSQWMVWSVSSADNKELDYSVVLTDSKRVISRGDFDQVKKVDGAVLVPVVSDDFRELIVDEAP